MRVISFDVATKSLAVSIIKYNLNFCTEIENIHNQYLVDKKTEKTKKNISIVELYLNLLDDINKILDARIDFKYLDVIDLIPGQKVKETNIVDRTKALYTYLSTILDPLIGDEPDSTLFLIEYQMGPNDKSRVISSQIMYHMSKYSGITHLVGPSLKNKIVIGGNDALYSNFIERYTTNYAANKNHAKFNFLKLIKILNKEDVIAKIAKKNIDDIADSVLMSLAFVIKHYDMS
jgi:hypothetical protein